MKTLSQWFKHPDPPITYDFNEAAMTEGLMGQGAIETVPPPATMLDLSSYDTPFCVLFNRPRNTLTGA